MPRTAQVKSVGLRGLFDGLIEPAPKDVGLDPGGRSPKVPSLTTFAVPGSFLVTRGGWYQCLAYGAGGTGGTSPGIAASDGGGGGAGRKRKYLRKGDIVTIAFVGGTCVITFPDGTTMTATGGGSGGAGYVPGGAGGSAIGADEVRTGGVGNGDTNPDGDPNTDDGVNTGTAGQGNPFGGDGSGAAFFEYAPGITGGRRGTGGTGGSPGANGDPQKAAIYGPEN